MATSKKTKKTSPKEGKLKDGKDYGRWGGTTGIKVIKKPSQKKGK